MIGISTAWKSDKIRDGKRLLDELQAAGFCGIELEYRISKKMYLDMKPFLRKGFVKVLSIHNFFPVPDIIPENMGSGDAFRLSSQDRDEREKGIRYTLKTLEIANDLGALAVVLHLGKVPIKTDVRQLLTLFDSGRIKESEGNELIQRIKQERGEKRQRPLDHVLSSLDKLQREAERLGVFLGIENRYFPDEIPDFEEIGIILKEFKGSKIRYWHDVGHANIQEIMGFEEKNRLMKAYAEEMIGIHLHGAVGYSDHYAPNHHIDFSSLQKYLKPETVKIIEAHSKVKLEDLKEGINHLHSQGIQ